MNGRLRVSWLYLVAFTACLLVVFSVLVRGTVERVNQINLVSSQAVLATADAVVAAISPSLAVSAWTEVQDSLRAMVSTHLRLRFRVATADGAILADSAQIRAGGQLLPISSEMALLKSALNQGRPLETVGTLPYEMLAIQPIFGATGRPIAALVLNADWERQYQETRRAIERETLGAAIVLLILVTGAFITVWRLWVLPLHCLSSTAKLAAGERAGQLEAEIKALKAEAMELRHERDSADSANAAKSDFLARMSHDLRTPLHGIIGFSEMISDQLVGPITNIKYVDYAKDIHQSGTHLLRLLNDVLDLSKIEAGRFELANDTVFINAIVGESIHSLMPLAKQRGLVLVSTVPADLPPLTADEKTLRQMLFNLLSNAIKFTEAGGKVTVSTNYAGSGHDLSLTVADTGLGIDPADRNQLFIEFGQAGGQRTRAAEGTGLGLVIVKSLIELHGGRIDLKSDHKVGTAVTLTFPADRLNRPPRLP
ncbi:MAG: ATP-binding protein [Rhodospirillaceae bacterium]